MNIVFVFGMPPTPLNAEPIYNYGFTYRKMTGVPYSIGDYVEYSYDYYHTMHRDVTPGPHKIVSLRYHEIGGRHTHVIAEVLDIETQIINTVDLSWLKHPSKMGVHRI